MAMNLQSFGGRLISLAVLVGYAMPHYHSKERTLDWNKAGVISEPRDDLLQEIPDLTCD